MAPNMPWIEALIMAVVPVIPEPCKHVLPL